MNPVINQNLSFVAEGDQLVIKRAYKLHGRDFDVLVSGADVAANKSHYGNLPLKVVQIFLSTIADVNSGQVSANNQIGVIRHNEQGTWVKYENQMLRGESFRLSGSIPDLRKYARARVVTAHVAMQYLHSQFFPKYVEVVNDGATVSDPGESPAPHVKRTASYKSEEKSSEDPPSAARPIPQPPARPKTESDEKKEDDPPPPPITPVQAKKLTLPKKVDSKENEVGDPIYDRSVYGGPELDIAEADQMIVDSPYQLEEADPLPSGMNFKIYDDVFREDINVSLEKFPFGVTATAYFNFASYLGEKTKDQVRTALIKYSNGTDECGVGAFLEKVRDRAKEEGMSSRQAISLILNVLFDKKPHLRSEEELLDKVSIMTNIYNKLGI